jgi:methionyl-tRNA synthetase
VDIKAYLKELAMENEKTPASEPETPPEGSALITIDHLAEVQLRAGVVRQAERIPKSRKLLRLMVDLGEAEPRQIVAGIAERYEPEDLVGRRIVVVANLKPVKLMGVESRGMVLAATDGEGRPYLLSPDGEVPPGAEVR